MAALDFPSTPEVSDTYTANGRTWVWNGESWIASNITIIGYTGVGITTITGTTHTFDLDNANRVMEFSNSSAITVTIPPNSSVAFPVGTWIEPHATGTGVVTIVAGDGVTLQSRGSLVALAGQFAVGGIRKVATNTWRLTGDLA